MVYKCEYNTTSENRTYAIRKPSNILDEWNSYPEIFSFSQALEISRQYLLLRTVILHRQKKKALSAPERCMSCYHAVGPRGPEGVKKKFTRKEQSNLKQKSERSTVMGSWDQLILVSLLLQWWLIKFVNQGRRTCCSSRNAHKKDKYK